MMETKRIKAFTLAELLVTMIISAVLILMVGSLSQIAFSSQDQIRKERDVYSDLFDGLSRISYLAHKASTLDKVSANAWSKPSGVSWNSDILIVGNSAFGFYRPVNQKIKFVFIPDKTNHAGIENILENIDTTILPSFVITLSGKSVSIDIQGRKLTKSNKLEFFAISDFTVTRRN
jgi:prepilin-type N-terminal cleavage/methylation domain-containing protein